MRVPPYPDFRVTKELGLHCPIRVVNVLATFSYVLIAMSQAAKDVRGLQRLGFSSEMRSTDANRRGACEAWRRWCEST